MKWVVMLALLVGGYLTARAVERSNYFSDRRYVQSCISNSPSSTLRVKFCYCAEKVYMPRMYAASTTLIPFVDREPTVSERNRILREAHKACLYIFQG